MRNQQSSQEQLPEHYLTECRRLDAAVIEARKTWPTPSPDNWWREFLCYMRRNAK